MMKRIIYLLAVMCISSVSVAQKEGGNGGADVRLYVGTNVLQLHSNTPSISYGGESFSRKVRGRLGVQFGGAVTFGKRLYFQAGAQYSLLSSSILHESLNDGTNYRDRNSLHVLSVPVKAGFRILPLGRKNRINFRVFGGFDGHHVLSADHKVNSGIGFETQVEDYHNIIVNGDIGLGVDFFFLFIDWGYQFGVTPVYTAGERTKANAFYSNFGFRFRLNK